jgi:hypothetical protein
MNHSLRRTLSLAAPALAVTLLASPRASAQSPQDGAGAASRVESPTGDRWLGPSKVGLAMTYPLIDDNISDVTILNFEVFAKFKSRGEFGAYGSIGGTHASGDGDSESGLRAVEAGGTYDRVMGNTWVGGHAGLTLPTADDEGFAGLLGMVASMGHRAQDGLLGIPDTMYLRFGGGVAHRMNNVQLTGALEISAPVSSDYDGLETVSHLGGGVALVNATSSFGAEFNLVSGGGSVKTLGVNGQTRFGVTTLVGTIVLPSGDGLDFGDIIGFTVGAIVGF